MSNNLQEKNENLHEIRAFVAIAKMGSFSAAAIQLKISRAHVSRQLSQLESRLGTLLIIRTTRSQRLTPVGEVFYARCQAAFSEIEDAITTASHDSFLMEGTIKINSVGGIIGEELIANCLHRFCIQYPNIRIELDFSSERESLISSNFDIVVRMGALEDSQLIGRKLGVIKIGTYASPQYLVQHPALKHPRDLKDHPCLSGSVKKWRYCNQKGEFYDVEISGNFQCKNGHVLLHAALQGNGICRLPELYCEKSKKSGQLLDVFSDWHIEEVPLYLLYHKNPYPPARFSLLIKHITTSISEQLSN